MLKQVSTNIKKTVVIFLVHNYNFVHDNREKKGQKVVTRSSGWGGCINNILRPALLHPPTAYYLFIHETRGLRYYESLYAIIIKYLCLLKIHNPI